MSDKYTEYANNQLKIDNRRRKYLESDVKRGKIIVDAENEKITFISSKEDSYERLSEDGVEFFDSEANPADVFAKEQELENLQIALNMLDKEEHKLIHDRYYKNKSIRLCAEERNISKSKLHNLERRILCKLHKILGNL